MSQPSGPEIPGQAYPQFPQPTAQVPSGGQVPPRRSAATPLIVAAIVVVVVLLLGGGLATALYLNRGGSDNVAASGTSPSANASPSPSASASSVAVYRKLPMCGTLPSATVTPLVPQGRLNGNTHTTTLSTMYDDEGCTWDNVGLPNKQPPEIREIDLTLHAYNDHRDTPTVSATNGLARDRSDWESKAGSTLTHEVVGPVTSVPSLGDGAFSQAYTMSGDDAPASGVRLYLVVKNVEAEIVYWGLDGTYEDGTPIPTDELSNGVQTIAHTVVDWLTSCSDCGS